MQFSNSDVLFPVRIFFTTLYSDCEDGMRSGTVEIHVCGTYMPCLKINKKYIYIGCEGSKIYNSVYHYVSRVWTSSMSIRLLCDHCVFHIARQRKFVSSGLRVETKQMWQQNTHNSWDLIIHKLTKQYTCIIAERYPAYNATDTNK